VFITLKNGKSRLCKMKIRAQHIGIWVKRKISYGVDFT